MMILLLLSRTIGKACMVSAVTLMLSTLAQAGRCDVPPSVPEANAGLVLIPVVGAVLFFASRHLFRKASLNPRDQGAAHKPQG